tara:strand:- start:3252 stop:3815 length:564 start_codon:yes stop_codon:yes gene_type:complete
MVRAILDGRKTQTRRVMKPQPGNDNRIPWPGRKNIVINIRDDRVPQLCPYGQPGDRLWVRETFRLFDSHQECSCYDSCVCSKYNGKPVYRADSYWDESKWKPSIYMPRWASRITLEVTGVRVERLQDIGEEGAKAEGVIGEDEAAAAGLTWYDKPRRAFRFLWESINGPGSWDANPWVWVVEFRRLT